MTPADRSAGTDVLFRGFRLKTLELPNRIVMAPMTRSFATDGVLNPGSVEYYRRRAEGGVGLILSEGTAIDRPASRNDPGVPTFHGTAALAAWQEVVRAVHGASGRIGPQLWHAGSVNSHTGSWEPDAPVESPSGLVAPGEPRGVAMTEEAIADTVAAFARGAADAQRMGFDLVELHGAHGYLIDQFFWGATNLRTDRYGGLSLRDRNRFACEIVSAIRAEVGPDFPISLRISQWKSQDYTVRLVENPDDLADWLEPLVDAGVDLLHCSQRRFWEAEFPEVDGEQGLNLAGWAKKLTGAATISVGSVGLAREANDSFAGLHAPPARIDALVERMARDEFDLIAVGRAMIADPRWSEKVRLGEPFGGTGFSTAMLGTLV